MNVRLFHADSRTPWPWQWQILIDSGGSDGIFRSTAPLGHIPLAVSLSQWLRSSYDCDATQPITNRVRSLFNRNALSLPRSRHNCANTDVGRSGPGRDRAAAAGPLIRNRRRSHARTIRLIESSPSSAIIADKHQANETVRPTDRSVQCRLTVSDVAGIRHFASCWGTLWQSRWRPRRDIGHHITFCTVYCLQKKLTSIFHKVV